MFSNDSHLLVKECWVPQLLQWYDSNRRDFPWRRDPSVYRTWICEVMSQQTTMAVVVPRFKTFVDELPDVESLAGCPDEQLRRLWAGLGYYARARNLRKGAEYIVSQLRGRFPADYESWRMVPGVGPYTASVIASICFGEPRACVDGNVIRVIARLTGCSEPDIWSESGRKWIQSLANSVIDRQRPGDFNQAMMELGATVCPKKSPDCPNCPLQNVCVAFRENKTHLCPPTKPRQQFESVELSALRITVEPTGLNTEGFCLLVERRKGFLTQTVGFPLVRSDDSEKLIEWLKSDGVVCAVHRSEDLLSHTITHHQLKIRILDVKISSIPEATERFADKLVSGFGNLFACPRWVSKSLTESGLSSSLDRKIWENISLF
jgi:A/G-specific adenine glycosylase